MSSRFQLSAYAVQFRSAVIFTPTGDYTSFAGVPWLETGFALWQEDGMCFERDYLVPLPSQNRESCVQYMADYTAMCALSKELYCLLRRPVFLPPQWHLAEEPLLITFSACRCISAC